jgi:hypothetical protein
MNDKELIQKAYEASLSAIYAAFVAAYTAALGDEETERQAEGQFRSNVLHARHIRDRALAVLP